MLTKLNVLNYFSPELFLLVAQCSTTTGLVFCLFRFFSHGILLMSTREAKQRFWSHCYPQHMMKSVLLGTFFLWTSILTLILLRRINVRLAPLKTHLKLHFLLLLPAEQIAPHSGIYGLLPIILDPMKTLCFSRADLALSLSQTMPEV